MDWEIWFGCTCLALLALWGVVELVAYVDRRNPIAHTRRQELARKRWSQMMEDRQ